MKTLRFGPVAWAFEGSAAPWLAPWVVDARHEALPALRVREGDPGAVGDAVGRGDGWCVARVDEGFEVVTAGTSQRVGGALRAAVASMVAREAPGRGALLVHAGAVRVRGGVALLVAPPGTGKSTAVRAAGPRAFAGNAVLVDAPADAPLAMALPFAGDPDPSLDAPGEAPVRAVLSLRRAEAPSVEWIEGWRATTSLARAVVRPQGDDPYARERADLTLALLRSTRHAVLRAPPGPGYLPALDVALESV